MQIDPKNQIPAKKRGRGDFNLKYKTYIILKYGKICAKKSFDFQSQIEELFYKIKDIQRVKQKKSKNISIPDTTTFGEKNLRDKYQQQAVDSRKNRFV